MGVVKPTPPHARKERNRTSAGKQTADRSIFRVDLNACLLAPQRRLQSPILWRVWPEVEEKEPRGSSMFQRKAFCMTSRCRFDEALHSFSCNSADASCSRLSNTAKTMRPILVWRWRQGAEPWTSILPQGIPGSGAPRSQATASTARLTHYYYYCTYCFRRGGQVKAHLSSGIRVAAFKVSQNRQRHQRAKTTRPSQGRSFGSA